MKLVKLLEKEKYITVAIAVFETIVKLLERIEPNAIDNEDVIHKMFTCVELVFGSELLCQRSRDGIKRNSVVELAGRVLSLLVKAMHPCNCSDHVSELLPTILNQFRDAHEHYGEVDYVRGLVFEELNQCCEGLGKFITSEWFYTLFDIFVFGLDYKDVDAICGLGTLMYYAGEQQAIEKYPIVLQELKEIRNEPGISDEVHTAIAKMAIANPTLVAINDIMPILIRKQMSAREGNTWICKVMLYVTERHADDVKPILEKIIRCVAEVYKKDKFENEGICSMLDYSFSGCFHYYFFLNYRNAQNCRVCVEGSTRPISWSIAESFD